MINPKLIFLLLACTAILAWACRPSRSAEQTCAEMTSAIDRGRVSEAQSYARELMADSLRLDTMSVDRLCCIAIAMAKVSESTESNNDYTAFALKCYNKAIAANPTAVERYISSLDSSDYRYASFLNQLRRTMDARSAGVIYTINEEGEDSTFTTTITPIQ